MAIINTTPDSFSGDGFDKRHDAALRRAEQAIVDGATLLDIGGESSRPGAVSVSVQEELDRVVPLVARLRDFGVAISVDTVKPEVMRAVIEAGADLINDINAFRHEGAVAAVANTDVALCVMHMQGEPRTMQAAPVYADVVGEVGDYLCERIAALEAAGVASARIVADPGFGFGKSVAHNYTLLRELRRLPLAGYPLLAGLSRKSMLGAVTGRAVEARLAASVTAAVLAVENGARIVRVHDVAATNDALKVWSAYTGI